MSSIRLSGSTSGYYDLTVPATAGTNSIDLSNLAVKDSNGNLGIGTASPTVKLEAAGDIKANVSGANAQISAITNGASNYATFTVTNGSRSYSMQIRPDQSNAFVIRDETGGGNRFSIDTDGRVTMPKQPCFDVASNQGVAANNYQTFNIQYHNVGNHFSLANNRFTAPVSGLYQFFATTIKSGSASGNVTRVYIYVNGSVANGNRHVRLSEGSSYGTNGVGSWIISMSAGDYAQVYINSYGSHSSSEYTYFNGYLLQ